MSKSIKFNDNIEVKTLEDIFEYTISDNRKSTYWLNGIEQCSIYSNRSIDDIVKLAFYYFPDKGYKEVIKSLIVYLYELNLNNYPSGLYDENPEDHTVILYGIILCPDIDRFVTVKGWAISKNVLDVYTYGGVFINYSTSMIEKYSDIDTIPFDSDLFSIFDLLECIYNELTSEKYKDKPVLELKEPLEWFEDLQEHLENYD